MAVTLRTGIGMPWLKNSISAMLMIPVPVVAILTKFISEHNKEGNKRHTKECRRRGIILKGKYDGLCSVEQ